MEKLKDETAKDPTLQKLMKFTREYGFTHTTSSPHLPRSNGFAESVVATTKATLKKCIATGEDPEIGILLLRATPIAAGLPTPAELLYGRPLQTILPSVHITKQSHAKHHEALRQRQKKQKAYFDKHTQRELPKLTPGDLIMVQSHEDKKWYPATVISKCSEPRSYLIQTTSGQRLRRNRQFLRKLPNSKPDVQDTQEPQDLEPYTQTYFPPTPNTNEAQAEQRPEPRTPRLVRFTPDAAYHTRAGRASRPPNKFVPD
ncbi:hypothetical protein CAPTEDRAFT_186490 [Capitella teleta]|uniref:Integrase catalytic domain-containing protein n=1 Tax=Capitella teleta TaxID=283909 RepID=R7UNC6_CAPTE|nr:hypothetical protein CAPTEDRAFT_186490 [Capitella teleta]|eukprot:ELU05452.1 hypothetical protein CAPTEDRAFT_186490 [Capitella teleta]